MHPQPRAFDAKTGLAAGKDEYAGAGAGGRPDPARGIDGADGGHQPARADDLAHDEGLPHIAAERGDHDGVARPEFGFIQPLAKPARAGGADFSAQHQRLKAAAAEIDIVGHRRRHAGRKVAVVPVVPGARRRQLAIGLNEDAGNQQQEDRNRHQVAAVARGRLRLLGRPGGRLRCARRVPGPRGRHRQATSSLLAIVGRQIEPQARLSHLSI